MRGVDMNSIASITAKHGPDVALMGWIEIGEVPS